MPQFSSHAGTTTMSMLGLMLGFPGGSVGKESAYNARNAGLMLRSGRFPREGNGNPLQYSCLENPKDRGTWQATVQRVAKSWTHEQITRSL